MLKVSSGVSRCRRDAQGRAAGAAAPPIRLRADLLRRRCRRDAGAPSMRLDEEGKKRVRHLLVLLLFSFIFSLFLWSPLGLFLFFPSAFIFTSLITHVCSSVIECSTQLRQTGLTLSALPKTPWSGGSTAIMPFYRVCFLQSTRWSIHRAPTSERRCQEVGCCPSGAQGDTGTPHVGDHARNAREKRHCTVGPSLRQVSRGLRLTEKSVERGIAVAALQA